MNWIDYREALGVGFSDEKKTKMLANKIEVLFDEISHSKPQKEKQICMKYFQDVGESNSGMYYAWHEVKYNILEKQDIRGLVSYTIAFSNASKKAGEGRLGEFTLAKLKLFLDELRISFELFEDSDGSFIFPKGAKELDDANVNIPYEWLKNFPGARSAMTRALEAYSNKEHPSQIADLFRKSLETFVKEFFGKNSSLENMKSEIGSYLKAKGIPAELSGNFETTLQLYTNYINKYAKHGDKASENCLEFIMYQTGNIIRFIISLSK